MEQLNETIQKYNNRLIIMKENRANETDLMNDAENDFVDKQIQMVAEFVTDLRFISKQIQANP